MKARLQWYLDGLFWQMVYNNYMKRSRIVSLFVLGFVAFLWCISGTAAIGESGNIPADAKGPADEIRKDNLKSTIEILERYGERSSWKKQSEAIAWARGQFEKLGIPCWIETYESDGKTWPNLFARIEGKKDPSALIMVIAHIDSKSSDPEREAPGADDNGTGVAVFWRSPEYSDNIHPGTASNFASLQMRNGEVRAAKHLPGWPGLRAKTSRR